jgi:hypothetical protein
MESGAMQEAGQRFLIAQTRDSLGQHKKCSLEHIFGVVFVAQDAPAHAQHHRPMSADQCGESDLIATVGEGGQQLFIALLSALLRSHQAAKPADAC